MRQPLLLIQGALDRLVPPYHAQRLQNVARLRGRRESTVELATLDGVNHLLLAASGAEQNASPGNPEISPRVAEILIDWIERTLPAE